MTRCPLVAHKVSGDNGLTVPWFQRVKPSKTNGNDSRGEQKPCAEMLGLNQLGKPAARCLLSIRLEVDDSCRDACGARSFLPLCDWHGWDRLRCISRLPFGMAQGRRRTSCMSSCLPREALGRRMELRVGDCNR